MYFRVAVLLSFYIKCVFSFVFLFFLCLLAFLHNDITSQFLGYSINHVIMQIIYLKNYIFCTQLICICYGQKIIYYFPNHYIITNN